MPFIILLSIFLLPPPNASEKRLNKSCLFSFLKKRAEKATNINIKFKIAIKPYILVILFSVLSTNLPLIVI